MKSKLSHFGGASLISLCVGASFGAAHADVVRGSVTDSSGAAPLEGALVTIDEIGRTTSTDRYGSYRMSGVPAGEYTLSVSYVGAPKVSRQIQVGESGEILVDVSVGENVRYLDNILVVGSAAAQAGAINKQRASNAIISVIDSDGLGTFQDTTVADSLSRVPGLSIETDQGEGRYVSIRGINTDLIASSINGVRTPSPEDRRGVLLDGVPSDLLDTIEVQKSLTPDVDADTLGGIINMQTISAFDRDGRFIRAKIEGSYNEITEEISPKATLTYSEVFGDRLGVALSVNYQDLRVESHNNETGGWDEFDGADFLVPQVGTYFAPADDYEMRFYDLTRERIGFVGNVDFRATDNTDLYIRALWNRYVDDEVRNKYEFREFDEEIVSATRDSVSIRRGEVDAEVRLREEVRYLQTYSAGGETNLGDWNFDYEASYAYAEEDDSNNHDVAFRSAPEFRDSTVGAITFDFSDPQRPVISGPAMNFLMDPSNYVMDAYEREFTTTGDTEWGGKLNIAKDDIFLDVPVTWKAGLKLRDREKVRDQNLVIYERDDVFLSDFIRTTSPIANWRLPNQMYNWPDAYLTAALRDTFTAGEINEEDTALESLSGDYSIDEQIVSVYGMGTFDIGPMTLVAGLRSETTKLDSRGNIFTEGDTAATVAERTYSDDYTHILPSVNLKYAFSDKMVGRAAYYAAVVRPAFAEIAPRVLFNEDRDAIEMGNVNLDPYEADNIDLSLEFYPTELSVISAGVFYKNIANAIFPATFDIADIPADIDLSFLPATTVADLTEISTFINAGTAELYGAEFNYVQQFGFLPAPYDGLLVSANLTLTESKTSMPDGREVPLLKQAGRVWNVAVGYDKGPWDLRVSANYRGDYLDEIFGTTDSGKDLDRYTDDRFRLEASVKYDLNDQTQLFLEGKNLTDEAEYYYHGVGSRLSQYDEFGTTIVFGARLTY